MGFVIVRSYIAGLFALRLPDRAGGFLDLAQLRAGGPGSGAGGNLPKGRRQRRRERGEVFTNRAGTDIFHWSFRTSAPGGHQFPMNSRPEGKGYPVFLATAPATRGEKRLAVAIASIALVLFIAFLPFVRTPLAPMPAFIPSYEAALFFIDLVTAILLFDQFTRLRSPGLLVLASGYLFDALIIVPHALSFPGAFAPTGLLGAREQTTAWLYVFWHGGFSLFVIAYALLRRREENRSPRPTLHTGVPIAAAVLWVALLTVALTFLATWGHDWLPIVMQGSDYSLLVRKGVSPAVWILTLLAIAALWPRRQRALDLWLLVVMWGVAVRHRPGGGDRLDAIRSRILFRARLRPDRRELPADNFDGSTGKNVRCGS
jgi:hypothetical protein